MMLAGRLLLLFLSFISIKGEAKPGIDWVWQSSFKYSRYHDSKIDTASDNSSDQSFDSLLSAKINWQRFTGMVALEESSKSDVTVQELFWQPEISLAGMSFDGSIGKERLDWGVGYGFRPLNIFTSYQRNPIGIQIDEGVAAATISYFDGIGEWEFVASDESWASQNTNDIESAQQQHGMGLRRYALLGDTELQGLAYYDQVHRGTIGGSVVTVLNPAWEVHGSFSYSHRYQAYRQGAIYDPVTLAMHFDLYQFLFGFNWANTSGLNIIGEYWYDGRSWSNQDWKQAIQRVSELANKTNISNLASSYSYGLNNTNLVTQNMMLHFKMDPSAWNQIYLWLDTLEPTLDILISPTDNGVIATPKVSYQMYDSSNFSIKLELAGRFYTGAKNSVYANVPDKHLMIISLKGRF